MTQTETAKDFTIKCGPLALDVLTRKLTGPKGTTYMGYPHAIMLATLMQSGQPVCHRILKQKAWPEARVTTDNAYYRVIHTLRNDLGAVGNRNFLECAYGEGLRLNFGNTTEAPNAAKE